MNDREEDILKRLVKAYLHFRGQATSRMIVNHIDEVGYGFKATPSPHKVTYLLKQWRLGKGISWFKVDCEKIKGELWWSLK